MDNDLPIVIDIGSGSCKAGFGGNSLPSQIIPSIVGRPRTKSFHINSDCYVGEAAQKEREKLTLKYPIEHGIITNWDDMEKIFHHIFYDRLNIAPEEHPVMLTEAPPGPKANREKLIQIMFETFNTPGAWITIAAVAALYSTGRTEGTVVDSGDGVTYIVPVYDGYWMPHATLRMDISGRDTTDYLMQLLNVKHNNYFCTTAHREIVKDIKEKHCYVASDIHEELERSSSASSLYGASYTLPDGKVIELGSERFQAAEVMFSPFLIGREVDGIAALLVNSIQKMDSKIRSSLYSNIVLAGGNTMFYGFESRLRQEALTFTNKVSILATTQRHYAGWQGASALSSLSSFLPQWITKDEYDESGPSIVHRKCF